MSENRTDRDLVRMALIYAIEERESFLDSWGWGGGGEDVAKRARGLIAGWKRVLKKRYGEELRDPLAGGGSERRNVVDHGAVEIDRAPRLTAPG